MGIDPNHAPLADLQLTEIEDGWLVKPQSEKGEKIVGAIKPLLEEGGDTPEKIHCQLKVDSEGLSQKLMKMFDHPIWNEIYSPALVAAPAPISAPPVTVSTSTPRTAAKKASSYAAGIPACSRNIPGWRAAIIPGPVKKSGYVTAICISSLTLTTVTGKTSAPAAAAASPNARSISIS
jgi:hypothetical protein